MKISENCTATISIVKKDNRVEFVRVFSGGQIADCGMFLKNNITNYDDAFNFVIGGYRKDVNTENDYISADNKSVDVMNLDTLFSLFVNSETDAMHYIFTGRSWKVGRNGKLHSLNRMTAKLK